MQAIHPLTKSLTKTSRKWPRARNLLELELHIFASYSEPSFCVGTTIFASLRNFQKTDFIPTILYSSEIMQNIWKSFIRIVDEELFIVHCLLSFLPFTQNRKIKKSKDKARKPKKANKAYVINRKVIIAGVDATLAVQKESPNRIQACRGLDCFTSAMPMQPSTNWTKKPTGDWSLSWFVIKTWKDEDEIMTIWKSYIRTLGWRSKRSEKWSWQQQTRSNDQLSVGLKLNW